MDFLKNLSLDEKEKHSHPAQAAQSTALSPPMPVEEHHGLRHKLSGVLGGESKPAQPPTIVAAPPPEPPKELHHQGGLLGRFSDVIGGEQKVTAVAPTPPPPPPVTPRHENLLEKLGGKLSGEHHDATPLPVTVSVPQPPPVAPKHESFLGKLGSSLSGESHSTPPPPPPQVSPPVESKHEHFIDKLSGKHHEAPVAVAPAPPLEAKHESFLGKITSSLGGESHSASTPPPPTVTTPPAEPKHEHLIDKLSGKHHEATPAPVAVAPAPPAGSKHDSFLGKIHSHSTPPPPPPVEQKHEGIFDRLSEAITGSSTPPPPPPPPPSKLEKLTSAIGGDHHHHHSDDTQDSKTHSGYKEDEAKGAGILGKIAAHRNDAAAPPLREESVLDKLGLHHHQEPIPVKQENLIDKLGNKFHHDEEVKEVGFADKITQKLAGGKREDDLLDKAIDLYQEHVLKEGSQKDESLLEQFKDKQIADAIREQYKHTTGHEFPIKEKKDEKKKH